MALVSKPIIAMSADMRDFVDRIKSFGFHVYLAERSDYGFITDDKEDHVLNFSKDGGLGGNYSPHTGRCGTGWKMDEHTWDLRTEDDVRKALYALIPHWIYRDCRDRDRPMLRHTTVAQHLTVYGASSRYARV